MKNLYPGSARVSRVRRHLCAGREGLPPFQVHPAAWRGPELAENPDLYTWELSMAEAIEIESAACSLLDNRVDLSTLSEASDFPLSPALSGRLKQLREELTDGLGFKIMRGLPLHKWPRDRAAAAFLGIGCHVGKPRPQNAKGHLLGHVTDLGLSSDDPNVRIYQTRERQTFHCDSCDIVALACLQDAQRGGESLLCSVLSVWNEILRRGRTDLAASLLEPVAIDRRGEVPPGKLPFFMAPPITWHRGLLGTGAGYQRQYISSAQARLELKAPRLTPLQSQALDLFDALLDDQSLHFSTRLIPGDVQFVYNHTLLHDRGAFVDDPTRRRHLWRLWLAPPVDRYLPASFAERFGSTVPGERGGITLDETVQSVVTLAP